MSTKFIHTCKVNLVKLLYKLRTKTEKMGYRYERVLTEMWLESLVLFVVPYNTKSTSLQFFFSFSTKVRE